MPSIQLRHDTSTNWTTYNPVLLEGEVGIETDTNKMKIGDGTTAYNSLEYFSGDIDLSDYYDKTETDELLDNKEDKFNIINPLSLGPTTIAIGDCYSSEYRDGAFTNYTETNNIDNSIPTKIRLFSPNADDGLQEWDGVGTLYVDLSFKYMKNSTTNSSVIEICKTINGTGRQASVNITGDFLFLAQSSYSQGVPLTVGETYNIRLGLNYYSNTANFYLLTNGVYNLVQTATSGDTIRNRIDLQNTDNPYKYSVITNFSISDIKVHTDSGSVLFSREVVNALSLKVGTGLAVQSGNLVNTNPTAPAVMTGATSSTAGTSGLVPAPQAGDDTKFLSGDGTYKTAGSSVTVDQTYNASSTNAQSGTAVAEAISDCVQNDELSEVQVVVESSDVSVLPSFYKVFSDGLCIQGGRCTSGTAVTFLKEFANRNYINTCSASAYSTTGFTPSATGSYIVVGQVNLTTANS